MQVRCGVVMFQVECVLQRIDSLYSDCGSWSFLLMTMCLLGCANFGRIDLSIILSRYVSLGLVKISYLDLGSLVSLVSHVGS